MRLRKELASRLGRRAFVETVRYAFPRAWSAGPKFCTAMASGGIVAAVLAPVPIVIVGILVNTIKEALDGDASGLSGVSYWIVLVGIAALVVVVCNALMRYGRLRLGDELSWRMQREILEHAATLDLGTLEDKTTQDILERANQEPGKKILRFVDGLLKVISSSVQVVGLAGVLLWITPFWSSMLLLMGLPFVLSKSYLSLVHFQIQRNKTTSRRWARYYARRLTQRESVPAMKLLGLPPLMLDRHRATMRDILAANGRFYRLDVATGAVSTALSVSVLMVAVVFLVRQAIAGTISPGALVAFWFAAAKLRGGLGKLADAISGLSGAQLSIVNTREFMDLKPKLSPCGSARPSIVRGEIRLEHVSFSYPRSGKPVIRDLSMTIRAGETVAIVGHNGAGKTTLAKLMTCLYPAAGGEVLIDGIPTQEYDTKALHERMAFVFQRPTRYEGTAFDNIAFGDWQRLLDCPEEVHRIAKAARVDTMIRQLPQGYDTLLGRMFGDQDLSGGQWQKLAIARALACDPSIVILDEPAANLDVNAEYELYLGIQELIRDRTTILISHRFSTVRMADRIFVLDQGRIVEEGTHDELFARGGEYSAMCKIHEATLSMTTRNGSGDVPIQKAG
ncbi:MAG: ABC transporter ATP-binding protein [Planctomycetes bacterium]|nr:ABC transporter ATP-binding protein [Planctomycetota bacterium]